MGAYPGAGPRLDGKAGRSNPKRQRSNPEITPRLPLRQYRDAECRTAAIAPRRQADPDAERARGRHAPIPQHGSSTPSRHPSAPHPNTTHYPPSTLGTKLSPSVAH
jgi:hypothetical protein